MMLKKPINIKEKIKNHIIKEGKKELSEKLLLKSLKLNQKSSLKDSSSLVKLATLQTAPVIKIKRLRRSREFPFIMREKVRVFLAVKSIISYARSKRAGFITSFHEEMSNFALNDSTLLKSKIENQEYCLGLKKYVYYRWLF